MFKGDIEPRQCCVADRVRVEYGALRCNRFALSCWLQSLSIGSDVQSLDDIEAMDLHTRYTALLKAYESVIQARNDDRKAFEQQA